MQRQKAIYAAGIGAGLIGSVLVIHEIRKWWIRRELASLRRRAANGEIPTRDFLNAVLESGQPAPDSGSTKVTIAEAQRLPCSLIFPASMRELPEFDAAIRELQRQGTCL